ncbi:MAG: hypothetical protein R6X10_08960 [Desulfobacterales bacterium]
MSFYFLTILFGAFQLTIAEFIIVSLIALTGYGLVIQLHMTSGPGRAEAIFPYAPLRLCFTAE